MMRRMTNRPKRFSRRLFLRDAPLATAALNALRLPAWAGGAAMRPTFEEIPPSQSGIHWTHSAGKTPEKRLPEISGAGCAFLDDDNDGWMDIFLVNSGKCDFLDPNPPLRNALYKNNRDGTFTEVTDKVGLAGGGYGMGAAVGDYNGDGYPDIYLPHMGGACCIETMAMAPSQT